MADLKLITVGYEDCTMGRLWVGNNFDCFTLELPWKNNQQNLSCYPAGTYKYIKRFSPSKQCEVIELVDVPQRTYCQIHAGNYTSQILGCTLAGSSIAFLNKDRIPDVTNSGATMNRLLIDAPDEGFIVVIRYGLAG
jgi:hypothetical protein